jgi:hypothetical protein
LQPNQGLLAVWVLDAPHADDETLDRGTIRAFKLPGQHLPGNVQPGNTVGTQALRAGFQPVEKLAFVLAEHVGKFWRHTVAGDDGELVSPWFKPQPEPGSFVAQFRWGHSSISLFSLV